MERRHIHKATNATCSQSFLHRNRCRTHVLLGVMTKRASDTTLKDFVSAEGWVGLGGAFVPVQSKREAQTV